MSQPTIRQVRPVVESGPVRQLTFRGRYRRRPPRHLGDCDRAERRAWAEERGLPAFRADQLARHYFGRLTVSPEEMTDLPQAGRSELARTFLPPLLSAVRTQVGDGGLTRKTLWRLFDGALIESVLMAYPERVTLCVSSQAGCGMACPFCATGQAGFTRNLSAAEILEQVRRAALAAGAGELAGGPRRLTNVVFMGMGEPLVNLGEVLRALPRLTAAPPEGFGISARNITVSTVGLVPGIKRLQQLGLPLRLAVSLHAPDDELRDELIPLNSRFKVGELLDAAYQYYQASGRRVSIEYALIKDMNDHTWRARLLAKELNRRGSNWAHVNPIPLNPTPGSIWTASEQKVSDTFVQTLRKAGIITTVRDTRGSDIDGACGQLAAEGGGDES